MITVKEVLDKYDINDLDDVIITNDLNSNQVLCWLMIHTCNTELDEFNDPKILEPYYDKQVKTYRLDVDHLTEIDGSYFKSLKIQI